MLQRGKVATKLDDYSYGISHCWWAIIRLASEQQERKDSHETGAGSTMTLLVLLRARATGRRMRISHYSIYFLVAASMQQPRKLRAGLTGRAILLTFSNYNGR